MKALIIEDEPLAVDNLIFYLKDYPIEIMGSAYRISDAIKLIKKHKPDVVFLDINLSGENGFDLLDKIDNNFKTIFVTAYDEYAIRAFEVNALDYILKPLKKDRIAKAMDKLFSNNHKSHKTSSYEITDSVFLSNVNRASFIKLNDICYIESESCYSKIVTAKEGTKTMTQTLKRWEEQLPNEHFVRVHRSYIVNRNRIKEIKKRNNNTFEISFNDINDLVEISRRYAFELKSRILK